MTRAGRIAIGLAAGAALGAAIVAGRSGADDGSAAPAHARPLGEPPAAALAIAAPRRLADGPDVTRWAHLRHGVAARVRPGRGAPIVARVGARTAEGTVTVMPVTGRRTADGTLWLRVTLPVLPNGTSGWVPRRALGAFEVSRHRLVVDLRRQRLVLLRRGRVIMRAPVGVGQQRWPTPRGTFIVRNRLARYSDRPAYGPVAFGTSARSPTLTDWPAGGFVGIHGTDRPDLVPGRVSHGCVRLRNPAILRLARLMPVGTPVEIR